MEGEIQVIGRVFENRYEVIRRLGSGGMAEVYLARDRHLERDVALKILSPKYAHDQQFIERFRREASNAAGLNHPNIVQIYDRGEAEGTYYIAMEYLEGRPLKDVIVRHAPLRADHVASITAQILEALRFAHRKDVVHRDIKPQNIIVDDEGRVKVTDFGIARAGNASTMTETGSILGTAHYLSPEQAQGGHAEAASDLYSLGVVVYEMATGTLPFTGENPVAIAMKHVHEPPAPPSSLVPGVPANLERVIMRALAKRPEDRYLTAQAFLEDIHKVQRGETVAPAPLFAPLDPQATATLSNQETRVMSASAGARPQAPQVRRTAPPERHREAADFPEPPRRRGVWPWLLVLLFVIILAGGLLALVRSMSAQEETVVVPGLVGLTEDQARTEVEKVGLTLDVAGEEQSTQYAPGQVTRQDPEEDTKLAKGKAVRVWLAAGAEQVVVPNLVGKTEIEAVGSLIEVGLKLQVNRESSETVELDKIIRQDPAADEKADRESTVTVWVSTGPATAKVLVPNLVGKQEQEAMDLLRSLKLSPLSQRRDSDRPEGEVVDQSLRAGTEVAEGSQVVIYVSNASITPQVTVPDVSSMSLTVFQAAAKLGQVGLVADPVTQPVEGYEPGTVFDQDPQAGAKVNKGSTVKILVAMPPPSSSTTSTSSSPTTSTTDISPPTS